MQTIINSKKAKMSYTSKAMARFTVLKPEAAIDGSSGPADIGHHAQRQK
jgi:hypothetical protein